MGRGKPSIHAQHMRAMYQRLFPDSGPYQPALDRLDFGQLPPEFFDALSAKGYGFFSIDSPLHAGTGAEEMLAQLCALPSAIMGGLETITVSGMSIFQSMQGNATLVIVRRGLEQFVFLAARYAREEPLRTLPVFPGKQQYGQPLLLYQVLKRAVHSLNGKP